MRERVLDMGRRSWPWVSGLIVGVLLSSLMLTGILLFAVNVDAMAELVRYEGFVFRWVGTLGLLVYPVALVWAVFLLGNRPCGCDRQG